MKIITLLGSARIKGNTATILARFEQLAAGLGSVERINLARMDLHGCRGCDACQRHPDEPLCAVDDDISAVLRKMLSADVIVYASPLYVWDFSGQMKLLLDRQYCLTKWQGGQVARSYLQGKRCALLVTCGDALEDNADLISVVYRRIAACGQMRSFGEYIVPNCSQPAAFTGEPEQYGQRMLADLQAALAADGPMNAHSGL